MVFFFSHSDLQRFTVQEEFCGESRGLAHLA